MPAEGSLAQIVDTTYADGTMALSESPSGRDYASLLLAQSKVIQSLDEGGSPRTAMTDTFDDVAAGFGAEKAIILTPTPESDKFEVLCHKGLRPTYLAALQSGISVKGISTSIIRDVIAAKQPRIVEHPQFMEATKKTMALQDRDYSVLCAPVVDRLQLRVEAIYYFQNQGPGLAKAYREADLRVFAGFITLLQRIFDHHQKFTEETNFHNMTLDQIKRMVTEKAIKARIQACNGNRTLAMESLQIVRPTFYRYLKEFGILTKEDERQQALAEKELASAATTTGEEEEVHAGAGEDSRDE